MVHITKSFGKIHYLKRPTPQLYITSHPLKWPLIEKNENNKCWYRFQKIVGEGKGGMIWENSTEACILPYVK